jgi:putative N-acetyltransferase (TIGR04045 family)
MTCIDDTLDVAAAWAPVEFLVREACQDWERREALALRRMVFCIEQGLFHGDDRDALDDRDAAGTPARLLVAMACNAGLPEQVVGTVRIHQAGPGLWWGSRLAVHPSFRSQGHLGATLIRLAVGRAHALGCDTFMAHVQSQNVPLFLKLRWTHPPCHDPVSGYVSLARRPA